ncbi:2458_t:CDS:2 [Diversispora eburnea]|uniref:2458_t:CDS:1 n=1 Tax=Diversispora eburnea TaxID=1213867 RepID=A0A9N9AT78_9GLOM|nr:2458_t:CDS:2 [Diversispora eburnea]
MQDQRNKPNDLSEIDLLRRRIIDLETENAEISELRNKLLKFAEVEAENERLRQIIEENSRRDAEFKSRIEELEKSRTDTASENAELKTEVAKLRHDFEEIKSKGIIIDSPDQLPISSLAEKKIVSVSTEMKNSNDIPEQIELQTENASASNISDITSNSSHFVTASGKDTHEQIVPRIEESIISSHEVSTSGNSDIQQELETSTSLIPATILLEEKEENEILDSMYKERVSKEIMERIREKKLRDQDLSLVNQTESKKMTPPSLCATKTVTKCHDQNTLDNSDTVSIGIASTAELSESDNQIVEGLIQEMTCNQVQGIVSEINSTYSNNSKSCIQDMVPGSEQSLSDLFDKAIKSGQKQILCWYYYSLEFENKTEVDIVNENNEFSEAVTIIDSFSDSNSESSDGNGKESSDDDDSDDDETNSKDSTKNKTGLDPWINSETSESKQIENADNHLSQDCIIKISKFPEEKDVIIEAVEKRFLLKYIKSNAWHRDVFKYTDSEAKCPICKDVHTRLGIWDDWSCLGKDDHYFLNCPFRIDQKKVIIAIQSLPENL